MECTIRFLNTGTTFKRTGAIFFWRANIYTLNSNNVITVLAVIKATLKVTFAIYIVFGSSWGTLIKVTFSHFVRELVIVDPFRAGGVKDVAEDLFEVEIEAGAGTGLQLCGKTVSKANSNAGAEFFLEADAEVVSEAFSVQKLTWKMFLTILLVMKPLI